MCELHCTCCNARARACHRPWLRPCARGSFCICRPSCRWCRRVLFCSFHFPYNCASKENNADNLPRLNHSYYLDRRPKRPAADRGLKSPDRPLQISAARPASDQFHERSAVRQHQCVGPNDKSSTSEGESDGCDGDRQRHHQQVERHADSHEAAEAIAADAVDHQMRLSRTARRCRGWGARSTEQQLVTTIAPAEIHAACIIVTRGNGSTTAAMAIAARRPRATEPRSRRRTDGEVTRESGSGLSHPVLHVPRTTPAFNKLTLGWRLVHSE